MSAPDPFGTPGWDAFAATARQYFEIRPPSEAVAAVRTNVERQLRADQARQEAAIRAELTARVKAALIDTVDHRFGDASGHLGGDGFDALAAAAVGALEQFYNDGAEAMKGAM